MTGLTIAEAAQGPPADRRLIQVPSGRCVRRMGWKNWRNGDERLSLGSKVPPQSSRRPPDTEREIEYALLGDGHEWPASFIIVVVEPYVAIGLKRRLAL